MLQSHIDSTVLDLVRGKPFANFSSATDIAAIERQTLVRAGNFGKQMRGARELSFLIAFYLALLSALEQIHCARM